MSNSIAGCPREQPGICLDLLDYRYQQSQNRVQAEVPLSPSVVSVSLQDLISINHNYDLKGNLDNTKADHEFDGHSGRGMDDETAQIIETISSNYNHSERLLLDCDLLLDILLSVVKSLEDGDSLEIQLHRLKLLLKSLKINIKSLSEIREEHTQEVLGYTVRKRKRGSDYKM
jgi:hypothetical protein